VDRDIEQDDYHIFFKDRPEWKDVVPLPQHSTPVSVIIIDYSAKCKYQGKDLADNSFSA
jgi:hypothetical protein